MISIIITSFKEPHTIGKAIESFLKQKLKDYEIIVLAPDKETLVAARKYAKKNKKIKVIKDEGKGKPLALNIAFKVAKGRILILSDGDVYVNENSVEFLVNKLREEKARAVSGKVAAINNKNKMFGYWAYILTDGFHNLRMRENKKGRVICSGYLYAIIRIINKIPENILADDSYISYKIIESGYKSVYEPRAEVYVKYPDNLREWISQKKRTAGRFYQLSNIKGVSKVRNFKGELIAVFGTLKEIRNLREAFWFFLLIIMRSYIWFRVFFDFRLWKRDFKKTWQRIESSK